MCVAKCWMVCLFDWPDVVFGGGRVFCDMDGGGLFVEGISYVLHSVLFGRVCVA